MGFILAFSGPYRLLLFGRQRTRVLLHCKVDQERCQRDRGPPRDYRWAMGAVHRLLAAGRSARAPLPWLWTCFDAFFYCTSYLVDLTFCCQVGCVDHVHPTICRPSRCSLPVRRSRRGIVTTVASSARHLSLSERHPRHCPPRVASAPSTSLVVMQRLQRHPQTRRPPKIIRRRRDSQPRMTSTPKAPVSLLPLT